MINACSLRQRAVSFFIDRLRATPGKLAERVKISDQSCDSQGSLVHRVATLCGKNRLGAWNQR